MSGEALGVKPDQEQEQAPDVEGFVLKQWIKGTALVTRSVQVCGRPQLMGHIEQLKAELERAQAAEFDDDRPLAKTQAMRIAEQIEAARKEMLGSIVTFKFRGLRDGELEELKADHGPVQDDSATINDLDYKMFAVQCVEPKGITADDFKALHRGDDEQGIEGLGNYFVQTIARTAYRAAEGAGVDVPFSSASSALTATLSKS